MLDYLNALVDGPCFRKKLQHWLGTHSIDPVFSVFGGEQRAKTVPSEEISPGAVFDTTFVNGFSALLSENVRLTSRNTGNRMI